MSDVTEQIEQAWREMDASQGQPFLRVRFDAGKGDIRLSCDEHGRQHFLMPVGNDAEIPVKSSTRGIGVREQFLLDEQNRKIRFLDIACLRGNLIEVFRRMIGAVMKRVDKGEDPLLVVPGVIQDFQEMLKKQGSAVMSQQGLVGLVGELLFLRSIVQINPSALQNWQGPAGNPQDFLAAGSAVEVKCSQLRGRAVHISSLEQLHPPHNSSLHLLLYRVDKNPGGDLSVPDLIEQVRACGVDEDLLEVKLEMANYDSEHAESYQKERFALHEALFYRVDSTFPRITRNSFADGFPPSILSVKYELDLNSSDPPVLDAEASEEVLVRMSVAP